MAHEADLYKRRNPIERTFGRLKDRRRIATRYDRYARTFLGAANVVFWSRVLSLDFPVDYSVRQILVPHVPFRDGPAPEGDAGAVHGFGVA